MSDILQTKTKETKEANILSQQQSWKEEKVVGLVKLQETEQNYTSWRNEMKQDFREPKKSKALMNIMHIM